MPNERIESSSSVSKTQDEAKFAEGFAKELGIGAKSAGTAPSDTINTAVVEVMKEVGIDLAAATPRKLTVEMVEEAELVVTMGCSVESVCPAPMIAKMRKKLVSWDLDDPKGKPIETVRRIRDEIKRKVAHELLKA